MEHIAYTADFCNCENPDHGDNWIAIGRPGNIMDYQICDHCGNPIQGTQTTHLDDEDEE